MAFTWIPSSLPNFSTTYLFHSTASSLKLKQETNINIKENINKNDTLRYVERNFDLRNHRWITIKKSWKTGNNTHQNCLDKVTFFFFKRLENLSLRFPWKAELRQAREGKDPNSPPHFQRQKASHQTSHAMPSRWCAWQLCKATDRTPALEPAAVLSEPLQSRCYAMAQEHHLQNSKGQLSPLIEKYDCGGMNSTSFQSSWLCLFLL